LAVSIEAGEIELAKLATSRCRRLRFAPRAATSLTDIMLRPPRPRPEESDMRAEIEKIVEEIKQSVGLLRRHL
ncbi:MAG: hypothetical protein E6501_16440, partial [Bradyrhizobium sp.]|nr:hypothetical protein [Bradyrhizobium sp.]